MGMFDNISNDVMAGTTKSSSKGTFKLLEDGWYPLAVKKVTASTTRAGQGRLSIQWAVLTEEGDLDSATKQSVFQSVLLPVFEDELLFKEDLSEKKDIEDDDELEAAFKERVGRDGGNLASLAFALFGYGHFSPIPLYNKESKKYETEDGEVVSYEVRCELVDAQKVEAINAMLAVARGDEDITQFTAVGKVTTNEYNGKKSNQVDRVRSSLPDGEDFAKI